MFLASFRQIKLTKRAAALTLSFVLSFIFILLLWSGLFSTLEETRADSNGMIEIFNDTGYYEFVAFGTGTRGDPATDTGVGTGSVTLNISEPMTNVIAARLIWTGRTEDNGQANIFDDDGVMLSINGGNPINIMADPGFQFEQTPWFANVSQLHESSDIAPLIEALIPVDGPLMGDITFDVSDHEHGISAVGDNTDFSINYGFGVWILYEYEAAVGDPENEVIIYEGQDSFFRGFVPPAGPHSDVQCVNFTEADFVRKVDMTHLVSGVDTEADPGGRRSNAFWYITGTISDTQPGPGPTPGLFETAGAIGFIPPAGTYPLNSSAGLEWDNFEPSGFIEVPANHTWACFQIESGDSTELSGITAGTHLAASGMWNFFGIRMLSPTAVDLISFNAVQGPGLSVDVRWQTASESDNFGYNLYRSATPDFGNAELIHFEPTAVFGGTGPGSAYQFTDTVPDYGVWTYWLEDVDTAGTKTVAGSRSVTVSPIRPFYLPVIFNP